MKGSRKPSIDSHSKTNNHKSFTVVTKKDIVLTPSNDRKLAPDSKTGGGISKSLLTPCRRLGLARNRGKKLKVFTIDESQCTPTKHNISKQEEQLDNENTMKQDIDNMKSNSNSFNDDKKMYAAEKNKNKSEKTASKTKISSHSEQITSVSVLSPTSNSIDIFTREPNSSQDSIMSTETDTVNENVDANNITKVAKNKISSKRSSKSSIIEEKNHINNETPSTVPVVILKKIPSNKSNSWEISNDTGNVDGKQFKNEKSTRDKSDLNGHNAEPTKKSNDNYIDDKKSNSEIVSEKKKMLGRNVPDKTKSEIVLTSLKKKSLTVSDENEFFGSNKSDKNRNSVSLGNTPKKLKIEVVKNKPKNGKNDSFSNMNKKDTSQSIDRKKSDGELLKKSKDKLSDTKKSKSESDVVLKKQSSGTISVSSSQSSMYSYQSDDDFEDKTIVERKTYNKTKKSKLQISKSKTSQNNVAITQKDIDEIKDRIKVKQEKFNMINESPKRGLTEDELNELIVAWRSGCQQALEELLVMSKEKGTMKGDADMEQLLNALHIPHDLVKYDPDQMVFE